MATNLKQHLRGKPNLMEAGGENREKNKGSSDSIEAMQCDRRLRIIWRHSPSGACTGIPLFKASRLVDVMKQCFPDEKDCPNLTSFPEVGLPSSLLQLIVSKCPKLKTECKRDKGKEWSKIANIRRVETYGSDSVAESGATVAIAVKFENEAEPGSAHVGVPAGVYLITKGDAHTSKVMQSTRVEEEYSSWQNSDQTVITTPNPQFQIWRRNDQQLMSWLLSTLSEEVLSAVVGARSSLDVWQILATQFGARSRARVLHLRTQIQTTKKGSTTIHEYYMKMKTTLDALRAAGSNISDEDFVLCLLAGLRFEYDSIVTTINEQPESTSLSDMYGMLLSHENRIEY
ncbi:hypothetical protein WN943_015782 [Citrus x changshan-huyou]